MHLDPFLDMKELAKHKHAGGFTLVEVIMVLTITAILAAGVAVFLRKPIGGYLDLARRTELSDIADTAVRRISRDLHLALPNSVRVVPTDASCLEFIPTLNGGRYRADVDGTGGGNVFSTSAALSQLDVLGPLSPLNPVPILNDRVVVYNLGIAGADAYAGDNMAIVAAGTTTSLIIFNPAFQFPFASPGNRFHVISGSEQSVFYVCVAAGGVPVGIDATGNGNGILYRLTRTLNAVAPTACPAIPLGTPILAQNLSTCQFIYANGVAGVTERYGLVSMRLGITQKTQVANDSDTVNIYHEVHVNNVP